MAILLISLVLLLILGVPIAYSLGVSGMLYFIIEKPELISVLPQRFFRRNAVIFYDCTSSFLPDGLINEFQRYYRQIN